MCPLSSQKFGRLETGFGVLNDPLRGNVGLIARIPEGYPCLDLSRVILRRLVDRVYGLLSVVKRLTGCC
jgi:hypothetical protein